MDPVQPSKLNINLLRVFEAVARHRSFSRAAAELGRSQATISVRIRDLEAQLELRLLERTTRDVTLTAAGEALWHGVQSGLMTIAHAVTAARSLDDARKGRVVLACAPSLSSARLPAMLAAYRLRDGVTRIDVEELTSQEIVAAVADGRVDFGVGPCPDPPPAKVAFAPVVEEPLYVVLPADMTGRPLQAASLKLLATLPLITLSGSVLLQRQLETAALSLGVELRSQTEVRQVQTAIAMARAGVGAAIVPRLALPDSLEAGVLALPIVEPPMKRKVGIVTAHGQRLQPAAARLARYLSSALVKALAAEIEASPPTA